MVTTALIAFAVVVILVIVGLITLFFVGLLAGRRDKPESEGRISKYWKIALSLESSPIELAQTRDEMPAKALTGSLAHTDPDSIPSHKGNISS